MVASSRRPSAADDRDGVERCARVASAATRTCPRLDAADGDGDRTPTAADRHRQSVRPLTLVVSFVASFVRSGCALASKLPS